MGGEDTDAPQESEDFGAASAPPAVTRRWLWGTVGSTDGTLA